MRTVIRFVTLVLICSIDLCFHAPYTEVRETYKIERVREGNKTIEYYYSSNYTNGIKIKTPEYRVGIDKELPFNDLIHSVIIYANNKGGKG